MPLLYSDIKNSLWVISYNVLSYSIKWRVGAKFNYKVGRMSPSLILLVSVTVTRMMLCPFFFSVSLDNCSMFPGILGNLGRSSQSLSCLAHSMYSVLQ